MRAPILFLAAALLAGCTHAPVMSEVDPLFADGHFASPAEPVEPAAVFALSEPMREFADRRIHPRVGIRGPRMALVDALQGELRIDYDTALTRTAAQTFETRSGNCLSLAIMTAAMARYLRIPVEYQTVYGFDTWTRSGGIAFHNGHINLVLGDRKADSTPHLGSSGALVIDFLPPEAASHVFGRAVPEELVLSMYLNNRAAELLDHGAVDDAYWYARTALGTYPASASAANTLGVIYLHHGDLELAARALGYALAREPDDADVLTNLANVMHRQGRDAEERAVRERLARIEPVPPFQFLDQGVAALAQGDYRGAIPLLEKELRRRPYDDEVQYTLALARLGLGDVAAARHYLHLAMENSTTQGQRDIYAAKLGKLAAKTEGSVRARAGWR